ncbi:phage major capsid protein [Methylobacterium durans]|uniref:phage major capsid protein n=1 Tax=Methylobacterium durans TaxID=2202825 RepID=UPI002AFEDC12|nr:phage major capsid protein [Methylobacterium durans]MEA1831733.1 phage major capsid protein [Methylobacterium durans]
MSYHSRHALDVLETKADEGDDPNIEKSISDLTAAFETKMGKVETELKAHKDRADALEVKINRPGSQERKGDGPTAEQKAFTGYVRSGRESLTVDEVKTLRVADSTAGGYLAPEQFVAEIIRDLVQFSPVRAAARVGQMSAGAIKLPRRTARIMARWVGEIEERPKTEPAYGQTEITAHEMACYVDVSNQLLEDAAIDIAAELSFDFAEEFGRLEGEAFVLGDGNKKPLGLLADPSVPVVAGGDATKIQAEALVSLMYSLPAFYRNRGAWMLNGPTIGLIRGMRDTTGRYYWQESIAEGQPPTLLGRPVVEAVDMPDVAPNATPVLFGDIQSAYRIYDRVGLSILRDPYSIATEGQTRFHARRRVGAGVVRPEAVRKLKIAAN